MSETNPWFEKPLITLVGIPVLCSLLSVGSVFAIEYLKDRREDDRAQRTGWLQQRDRYRPVLCDLKALGGQIANDAITLDAKAVITNARAFIDKTAAGKFDLTPSPTNVRGREITSPPNDYGFLTYLFVINDERAVLFDQLRAFVNSQAQTQTQQLTMLRPLSAMLHDHADLALRILDTLIQEQSSSTGSAACQ